MSTSVSSSRCDIAGAFLRRLMLLTLMLNMILYASTPASTPTRDDDAPFTWVHSDLHLERTFAIRYSEAHTKVERAIEGEAV